MHFMFPYYKKHEFCISFKIVKLFLISGIDQKEIIRELNISTKTAVDWDNFCRKICDKIMNKRSEPIGGSGIRVQIEESKFRKREYHSGRYQ